ALRLAGASAREPGVPLPVRERRGGPSRRPPRVPGSEPDRHRDHVRPVARAPAPGLSARPAVEPRADPHPARELGPAPRGQPLRAPVRAAGLPEGGLTEDRLRILYITAGAGGMYCGSCLRDNTLAAELLALGHDVSLLPVYTPTRTDEENVSADLVF